MTKPSSTRRSRHARFRAELERWFDEKRAQGAGIWQLDIVSMFNIDAFAEARADGEPDAVRVSAAIGEALATLQSFARPDKHAPMCLLCPAILWSRNVPLATAVLTPLCDQPAAGTVNFVCRDCVDRFADAGELRAALLDYYRTHLMPDLRVLPPITSAPGHA